MATKDTKKHPETTPKDRKTGGIRQKTKKLPQAKWFNDNGQLAIRGRFKDDQQDGLWEYFDNDGHLAYQGIFKNGKDIHEIFHKRTHLQDKNYGNFF